MTAVTSAIDYSTLFSGMIDEGMSSISTVVPLAAKVAGTLLAIGIGYKVIRRFAK
jgi:hypothetical protein